MNAPYKQTIFTAILIFAFCLTAFAQTNEDVDVAEQPTLRLLAQFNDTDSEWYKLTPDLLATELASNPSEIGLVRIKNDKNFARRLRMLRLGFAFRRVSLSQVMFLLIDKQEHDTEVLAASSCSEIPKCEDCIVIRAADLDKIEKLFKPKTITKRRKKK